MKRGKIRKPGTPEQRREQFIKKNYTLAEQYYIGGDQEAGKKLAWAAELKQLYPLKHKSRTGAGLILYRLQFYFESERIYRQYCQE